MDLCIISFHLNCIMQLKQFYNIATKVNSRKKCYNFWWSAWLMSQSGASGWTSWALSSYYQMSLDRTGSYTASSSPDQLYSDSRRWEKPVSSHDSDKGTVFPWCGHPQQMPMWPWVARLVSRTRWSTLEMPPCDTPVFLDIALWDSPWPDNRTMSSKLPGGILAGMISTLFWNCNLCTATENSWMYSIQMQHTVFRGTREIRTPHEWTD